MFFFPSPQNKNWTKTGSVVGIKPTVPPNHQKPAAAYKRIPGETLCWWQKRNFSQLILNHSCGLYFSIAHAKSCSCMCQSVFFLCVGMRRAGSATILSLCSVGERSLAPLLSHSCSQHLSSHLDWPPRPVCWFSLLQLIYSVECLPWSFFSQNKRSQSGFIKLNYIIFNFYCNFKNVHMYMTWCVIFFKKWLDILQHMVGCPDLHFCAHLNPHVEGSGEMHSSASLATDVGKNFFFFFFFELNLWSV